MSVDEGTGASVVAQREAAALERLDDLVDRLLAEVRDRVELVLGFRDEVADGLDARALEAVVRTHAQLQLLDQDVVHRVRGTTAGPTGVAADAAHSADEARLERTEAARVAQLDDAVGVGEDRQLADENLSRLAQRGVRVDRAIGLDVERQLVEVRLLADARLLDGVRHTAHRREDRVDRDDADRLVGGLVLLSRAVAATATDRQVDLELGSSLERRDVRVRVEDLDAGGQIDVLRGDLARARDDERRLDLGRVGVHPADDALEVEDDVGHVLLDPGDRRELVRNALDADARDGRPGERAQQHAAQRVAERVAEAAVERLDREGTAVLLDGLGCDSGDLEIEHRGRS